MKVKLNNALLQGLTYNKHSVMLAIRIIAVEFYFYEIWATLKSFYFCQWVHLLCTYEHLI